MTLFGAVIDQLNSENIPCAVIGASALAVHGIPRSTYDIDLLSMSLGVLEKTFWPNSLDEATSIDIRRGGHEDPLRGVIRFKRPGDRDVDIIVGRHAWQGEIIARATPARLQDREVPVASISDLILLKLYAGGVQDRWDIEQLLAVGDDEVRAQVAARISALPSDSQAWWADLKRPSDDRQ